MSTRYRHAAIVLALALLASPGCLRSSELSGVRRDLESQLPGTSFDKELELSLGPALLGIARLVTAVIPDAQEARPFLRGMSRVQIGVYKTEIDSLPALRMPRHLQTLLDDGWETVVRVHENDESVWVLYRPDGDRIREVFVVVLNDHELVLVKAKGKLEKIVAAALDERDGGHAFIRQFGG
jgi:hypothetical protein